MQLKSEKNSLPKKLCNKVNIKPILESKIGLFYIIVPRPSEVEGSTVSKETETFSETEGTSNVYVKEYVSPLKTDLELKRTFAIAGKSYKIVLIANNMHNQEDNAKMTW